MGGADAEGFHPSSAAEYLDLLQDGKDWYLYYEPSFARLHSLDAWRGGHSRGFQHVSIREFAWDATGVVDLKDLRPVLLCGGALCCPLIIGAIRKVHHPSTAEYFCVRTVAASIHKLWDIPERIIFGEVLAILGTKYRHDELDYATEAFRRLWDNQVRRGFYAENPFVVLVRFAPYP